MEVLLSRVRSLLTTTAPALNIQRLKGYVHRGGRKYPGGITYYPRFPGEEDPVFEPSKLFRIERIKPIKNTTKIQRNILERFKIGYKGKRVSVVKNIPEVNAILWQVKHLIKITPITFPNGEPTIDDLKHTVLNENGQCVVTKKLVVPEEALEAYDEFRNNPAKMDGGTITKETRLRWVSGWTGGY